MEFCKYHPLQGATHKCIHCNISFCDSCIDERGVRGAARCFLCGFEVESLGASNTVEPFWRRLQAAFKYPLNASSMSLLVIVSLLLTVASFVNFLIVIPILILFFSAGAMLKYSFSCLESTALGKMQAPDVLDAYQGGTKLVLQLAAIIGLLGMVVSGAAHYLGNGVGGFLLALVVFLFPAILIRFALTESMLEALNPLAALTLISAMGLAYGILIAFMLIMMSSVGVLHELIGKLFPALSYLLQNFVSNYYTLVLFHLMGYVIFQYQGKLGFVARQDDDVIQRSDLEYWLAKIEVFLKEGDYEQVVTLYYQAFKQYPSEFIFYERYFDLLLSCKKDALMRDFGSDYLSVLIKKNRTDKVLFTYKQILTIVPDFMPSMPALRLKIAQILKQQGDLKQTVKLLNGLHKVFPDFAELVGAYELMAEALDEMPGMQVHAEKCRKLIEQIVKSRSLKIKQQDVKLTTEEKMNFAEVKTKRLPPSVQKSNLVLELVPIDQKQEPENA